MSMAKINAPEKLFLLGHVELEVSTYLMWKQWCLNLLET